METENIKILAIDDNQDNLLTLKVLIKERYPNVTILIANNGKTGLEIAELEIPHVILLNIIMPGMDGFEVCERLKSNKVLKDIPVVFVTALGAKENRIKALESGGEGFLSKPIDESELFAQINAMLKIRFSNLKMINEKKRLEEKVGKRTEKFKNELLIRKKAEDLLSENLELTNSIMQSAADAIISFDENGKILRWNSAAIRMFGVSISDKINTLFDALFYSECNCSKKDEMVGKTIEIDGLKEDGSIFPVELSLSCWSSKGKKFYTGIIRDISERKEQQKIIENSEKRLSQIIENSQDWVWEVDINGLYTYSSGMLENILGYSTSEVIGKKYFYDFFHKKDKNKLKDMIFEVFEQKKPFRNFINRNISKDQEVVWVSTSAVPMLDLDGNLIGYRGADKDITKQINNQEVLKKAKEKAEESSALKTEFFNNMSHEIRTPMNGILGFSEMLSDPNLSVEKRANFVRIIQNSGQQLLHIIDDILELSRLGKKQIEVLEEEVILNDLLFELFSLYGDKAKEKKVPIYIKKGLSDVDSLILIDGSKLRKALNKIIENALKFTNEGCIEFSYKLVQNELHFFVKDTGVGIDPKKLESIFEPFSQAEKDLSKKVGGLGLGLTIAKENVKLLGGNITVESVKGKGSTFVISVPIKMPNRDLSKSVLDAVSVGKKSIILIAEDDEINYLYLEALCENAIENECEIIHVKNGKEAVEICRANEAIDIVLMDLKMPVLDGFLATKLIKEFRPDLKIIAQTAYSRPEEKEKALMFGCDDFISKPISYEIIKSTFDKYLNLEGIKV